jgi:hypothetical protein
MIDYKLFAETTYKEIFRQYNIGNHAYHEYALTSFKREIILAINQFNKNIEKELFVKCFRDVLYEKHISSFEAMRRKLMQVYGDEASIITEFYEWLKSDEYKTTKKPKIKIDQIIQSNAPVDFDKFTEFLSTKIFKAQDPKDIKRMFTPPYEKPKMKLQLQINNTSFLYLIDQLIKNGIFFESKKYARLVKAGSITTKENDKLLLSGDLTTAANNLKSNSDATEIKTIDRALKVIIKTQ